jgi:hypothetical protein
LGAYVSQAHASSFDFDDYGTIDLPITKRPELVRTARHYCIFYSGGPRFAGLVRS